MKFPIEVVLSQINAPELGRVQDVRDSYASQVLLLPQGGPVAKHNSGKDFVAVNALSDSLVLGQGRRNTWHWPDVWRGHQKVPVQDLRLSLTLLESQAGHAAAVVLKVVLEFNLLHWRRRRFTPSGIRVARIAAKFWLQLDGQPRVLLIARVVRRGRRVALLHGLGVDGRPPTEPAVQQLDVFRAEDVSVRGLERPPRRLSFDARLPTGGEGVLLRVPPDHLVEVAVLCELLLPQLLPPVEAGGRGASFAAAAFGLRRARVVPVARR